MSAGRPSPVPTVVELVRQHAELTPERAAFVTYDGGARTPLTYAEFDRRTDQIAAGLRARGLTPGDRVALLLDNSDAGAFYQLLHGSYKAAVVPVPINARLAPPEVAYIVNDADSRLLVGASQTTAPLSAALTENVEIVEPSVVDELVGVGESEPVPEAPGLDAAADLLYTSGTTGRPKGARFRHRALGAFAQQLSATLRLSGRDVFQTPAPVYTSTGTHTLPLPVLAVGGTYVVEPYFDVDDSATRLAAEAATIYFAVPAMWILMLDRLPVTVEFPELRSLLYGGSIMPEPVIRRLLNRFKQAGLWNLYGLTEAGPNGTVLSPDRALSHTGSVGLPLAGTDIRIVDEGGHDLPAETPGEILIRAPSLMDCYHNMPDATTSALVDGWLHTGDIGRRDADGFLYLVDRKKDMIVRGGFNVYPAEVEAVLLEHPGVAEAAVVGVQHEVLGEDVAAVVVPRANTSLDKDDLARFCRGGLADFKCPRHWQFVDALPRNAMGKLLKRELRDLVNSTRGSA